MQKNSDENSYPRREKKSSAEGSSPRKRKPLSEGKSFSKKSEPSTTRSRGGYKKSESESFSDKPTNFKKRESGTFSSKPIAGFKAKTDKPFAEKTGGYKKRETGSYTDKPRDGFKKRDQSSFSEKPSRYKKRENDTSAEIPRKNFKKKDTAQYTDKPRTGFGKRDSESFTSSTRKEFKTGERKSYSDRPSKGKTPYAKSYANKPHPFEKFDRRKKQTDESETRPRTKTYTSKKDREDKNNVFSVDEKQSNEFRLNKYIAHAGIASRRAADELIREGRVKVNGQVVTEMGFKVKPTDDVQFDGQPLSLEKKYYLLFNKPKDCITTVTDEHGRKTVMDIIRPAYAQMKSLTRIRLYPVGRLDRNTTGILLITNDGELAQQLTHPSSEVKKVYQVLLDKKLRKDDFDKIAEGGVVLEDGIAEVDEIAYPNPDNRAEVGVEIHTGKNRFVRRLFEALGYEVLKLDRVFFAGLTKKELPRGRWRFLNEEEVRNLKHFRDS